MSKEQEVIVVKGARTHNLKNITVQMPRNKMIVFTGLSGSGKSSLAFDTIFAEGQRRYVESLSSYARQFLRQMGKPDVDEITGLSPAISIDQKSRSNNPRSTVATVTEIYDYLRVLYARVGVPHCLLCDRPIKKLSNEEIKATILETVRKVPTKKAVQVLGVPLDKQKVSLFAPVVVGRKGEYYQLLYDLLGKGYSEVLVDGTRYKLRERITLDKNKQHHIDVLVDEFYRSELVEKKNAINERLNESLERALFESNGLVKLVIGEEVHFISTKFLCPYDGFSYPEVEPRLFSFNSPHGACQTCNGLGSKFLFSEEPCDACAGNRLRPEALKVRIAGKNIIETTGLSVAAALSFFDSLQLSPKEKEISAVVVREITARLTFMLNVGLDYLTLDRKAHTLSGGEAQRIRLASQLGSGLVGALYVLDEPTIGLHARDNDRLIKTLTRLRDLGNTIIVVEHDEDTIFASDYLVDIGPGAGVHGGNVIVADWLEKLLTAKKNTSGSLTLSYLRNETSVPVPTERREQDKGTLRVRGATLHNISNLDVDVPLGRVVAITGVSGSGKSTFMYDILHKNLLARLERKHRSAETYHAHHFSGTEYVSRAVLIDQSPIGRTPRSNPATYTGAFTYIRELFAASDEARVRGWKANRFSFNVPTARGGGRCEACEGNGEIAVEMHFLPTVYVTCDVCDGKRFMKDTLEVRYKKKNIYDVLNMTIEEALTFFGDIPAIADRVQTLADVGLSYLTLGQSATTLSGGEAQRVKIASELYRTHVEKTVYLLDEPTIGLHYEDVRKLIEILNRLVAKGNSVIVIEHNMEVIKSADYLIDFGPEGGTGGGTVVAKGTPEQVAKVEKSHTGQYLKKYVKGK